MANLPLELDSRKYLRAAIQRLAAAEQLFELRTNLDAVYLAGYSVECALKSLILRRINWKKLQMTNMFHGRQGHDIERLKELLSQIGCRMPAEIARDLARVKTWSTDLRYETGRISDAEAESFILSTKRILKWVQRSAL